MKLGDEQDDQPDRWIGSFLESVFSCRRWDTLIVQPRGTVALPDAEFLFLAEAKLCDRLPNPSHPVGGPKAAWFASIGYIRETWSQLRDDLFSMTMSCKNFVAKPSPYSVKHEASGLRKWLMIAEYSMVALNHDKPASALFAGDVGAICVNRKTVVYRDINGGDSPAANTYRNRGANRVSGIAYATLDRVTVGLARSWCREGATKGLPDRSGAFPCHI